MTNLHQKLDHLKLLNACAILKTVDLAVIRARSISNLNRWNANGVWVAAHDEWRALMVSGTDQEIVDVMAGTDDNSNRLRQSPPYTGLLSKETRDRLRIIAGFKLASDESVAMAEQFLGTGKLG
jgi:ethanolamine utilization protein EutP (predicted NTPase)